MIADSFLRIRACGLMAINDLTIHKVALEIGGNKVNATHTASVARSISE